MLKIRKPSPTAHPEEHDLPLKGILCKLVAVMTLSTMSAIIKWLGSQDFPTGQIMFYRSAFAVVPIIAFAMMSGRLHLIKTKRIAVHAERSLVGVVGMYCSFAALALIPLATAVAINFAAPLFITVLAVVLLGERVHAYRWSAVAVGFAGVLVMVGPNAWAGGASLIGTLLALAGAFTTGFAMTTIRRMSAQEHSITIAFYFSVTCAAFGALSAFWGWQPQNLTQTALLITTGLLGGVGQLMLSFSYRYAEASVIAPLDYVAMIFATIYGYFIFSELPTLTVWIGASIVIGSGLLIIWREQRRRVVRAEPI